MSIVNITDPQRYILDKVFSLAHRVLYNGVSAPSSPAYMPVNQKYKDLIDTPPSSIDPVQLETDTKDGTRTAVAALVASVTNTPMVAVGTTLISAPFSTGAIVSATFTPASRGRNILVMYSGRASATVASSISINAAVNGVPSPQPWGFQVAASGLTYLYGSWVLTMPTNADSASISVRCTNNSSNTVTFDVLNNQIMTIYG